jgi:hypothetical protein
MMGKRMPQKSRNRKFARAALCAAAVTVLFFTGSAAVRAEDDGSDGPYTKFWHRMMSSVGLRDPDPGIEYKERPPLVVPPSRNLPAPATASSPAAKNADWPTDPDRKKRPAKPKTADGSMLAGAKADDPTAPAVDSKPQSGGFWSSFSNIGSAFSGPKSESAQFQHEPSRNALTDPPAGYRTPSPIQPYGIIVEKEKKSEEDKQADMVNGQPQAPK